MNSLPRSLRSHSPAMLRAIAESDGIELGANQTTQMAEQVAAALSDPEHVRAIVAACTPAAQEALAALLRAGGRSPRPAFERRYGAIRPAGPARLERERPHLQPANATEELWYRGLLHLAMAETDDGLMEFLHIPPDLAELLPSPAPVAMPYPPAPARALPAIQEPADLALHDACTLLCLSQAGLVALRDPDDLLSWQSTSLYEFQRSSLQPPQEAVWLAADGPGSPPALALALAVELGWLRANGRRLALAAAPVQAWLAAARPAQRSQLLSAWSRSTLWNDLCRTPALSCEQTGSWSNDPVGTRQRLMPLLARLQPGSWYDLAEMAAAVKAEAPDFQRPDGNYDTWYIRQRSAPAFLRGFEHWDQVEGELLRFVLAGPLHWLGATALAAAGASAPHTAICLTPAGHAWLADGPAPPDPEPALLSVQPDFTVLVPASASLLDRFRVARFTTWQGATWEQGQPAFTYRISQTGLGRAAQQGIDAGRVLAFLQARAAPLPANVARALERRTMNDE